MGGSLFTVTLFMKIINNTNLFRTIDLKERQISRTGKCSLFAALNLRLFEFHLYNTFCPTMRANSEEIGSKIFIQIFRAFKKHLASSNKKSKGFES